MTIAEVENNFNYHHTALTKGYVSRKCEGIVKPYKGRFGEGYKILRPNWQSVRYSYVEYWVK